MYLHTIAELEEHAYPIEKARIEGCPARGLIRLFRRLGVTLGKPIAIVQQEGP